MSYLRTTITFKGRAKEFVSDLGKNKSSIISSLIVNALRDGTMLEILKDQLPQKQAIDLAEKHCVNSHILTQQQTEIISTISAQERDKSLSLNTKESEKTSLSEFDL